MTARAALLQAGAVNFDRQLGENNHFNTQH
jgi:hypothetical protein